MYPTGKKSFFISSRGGTRRRREGERLPQILLEGRGRLYTGYDRRLRGDTLFIFPVSLVYIKMHRRSLQLQMHLRQMRKESQQISLMIYCHCKLFYKLKEQNNTRAQSVQGLLHRKKLNVQSMLSDETAIREAFLMRPDICHVCSFSFL